ncbi:MAG: hypothetical protein LBE89_02615 [Helicobacteraceae bacterium]|nr:hypothetical protein [Helicobacteraceae bacterium]
MEVNANIEEQRAAVDALFLSQNTFESEVFLVNDSADLRGVMKNSVKAIVERPRAKITVNFKTLTSYADFKIEGCVMALRDQINEEIEYLIREEAGFDPIIVKEVRSDITKQSFINAQAKKYFIEYIALFKEAIADTFLECVLSAHTMNSIKPIVQEVIDGVGNYAPVLIAKNGMSIVRKSDQIWMRLKQAKLAKEKAIGAAKDNVERLSKKLNSIRQNIQAIHSAKEITLESIMATPLDELKEIIVNEDGLRTEKKRIFQFIPKGDITLYLAERMDKGRRVGTNDVQKEEYRQAAVFFENCNINNTGKELANKLIRFGAEIPTTQNALEAAKNKLAAIEANGLHLFDETVDKIRRVFIENIGKTRL